jgi:hypothetical protein
VSESHGYNDFLSLDSDQLVKAMWGALARALDEIEDIKAKI